MASGDKSELKIYSMGVVSEDKKTGSDLIKVAPMEKIPFFNGEISGQGEQYNVEAPDGSGVNRKSTSTSEATIVAKWVPFGGSNRMSAPDVTAGETVVLFTFADTNDYFWTTIFREPKLRKLEKVLYAYSNTPSGQTAFDMTTSYWVEVDTIGKSVTLHTSKNDGEPFSYDIKLDTRNGNFSLKDNVGNTIGLDSKNSQITLESLEKVSVSNKGGDSVSISSGKVAIKSSSISIEGNLTVKGNISASGSVHGTNI